MIDVISFSIEYEKTIEAFWSNEQYVIRLSFKHTSGNLKSLVDAEIGGNLECLSSDSESIIIPIVLNCSDKFTMDDVSEIIKHPTIALLQTRSEDPGLRFFANLILKTFDTSSAFEIALEEKEFLQAEKHP